MVARRQPSALAEKRLSTIDARFSRHLVIVGLLTAPTIVLTYGAGVLVSIWLARLGAVGVVVLLGRFIQLIVQRQRMLMAILIDDGMSKDDARSELLWRFGRG
jgi:hypothetical protein